MARWSVFAFVLLQVLLVLSQNTETPETPADAVSKETPPPPTSVEPTRVTPKLPVTNPPLVHNISEAIANTTLPTTTFNRTEPKNSAGSLRGCLFVSVLGVVLSVSAI